MRYYRWPILAIKGIIVSLLFSINISFANDVSNHFIKKLGGKTKVAYCKSSSIVVKIENDNLSKTYLDHEKLKHCTEILDKGKGMHSDPNVWRERFQFIIDQSLERMFSSIANNTKRIKLIDNIFIELENTEKLRKYFYKKINKSLISIVSSNLPLFSELSLSSDVSFSLPALCEIMTIDHLHQKTSTPNELAKPDAKKYYKDCLSLYSDQKKLEHAKNNFSATLPNIIDSLILGPANSEEKIDQILKELE